MTTEFGAKLRMTAHPETACDGQLTIYRWAFDVALSDIPALAVAIGRSYVTDAMRLAYPNARVRDKVPSEEGTTRKGDFGEMIAHGIYSTRMGRTVPFSKLQLAKPVAKATVQGPDNLCLTITQGEDVEPVIVEAKWRLIGTPAAVLGAIESSVKGLTEQYCAEGWAAGVQLMHAHPDHRRHFAFAAAQHLGRLIDPNAHLPPHLRHAVAVVGEDRVPTAKIEERWPGSPPVTQLHVVTVMDYEETLSRIFGAAGKLTYADLTGGASTLVSPGAAPGISGLISPEVASRAASTSAPTPLHTILESSLWYLADEDGLGLARARMAATERDPDVRGLAELLTGALGRARGTLDGRPLADFADAAREVLDLQVPPHRLRERLEAATNLGADLLEAAQHVAAALIHRIHRHPLTMTVAKGATGVAVRHVVDRMRRIGRHAFWPSQADAVRGGLLDPAQRSLAIKMPTSAGKTTLMELVAADTIDRNPDGVVAVIAPTRALVSQLYRDLREGLPADVDVRSSQGGLDYDTDLPSTGGVLDGPGVAVVTPERLDLDWRRAMTDDGGIDLEEIRLLIVDEAHTVDSGPRGATLELLIAKALRRGIRVVLLASQFSDVNAIANWVNGDSLESAWRPAWLERHVYIRGDLETKPTRARLAYLWPEGADPTPVFKLKPSAKTEGDGWIRERPHEAAGLVQRWTSDGLVVVFTENKSYAQVLLDTISADTVQHGPPRAALAELAGSIERKYPVEAMALRNGFGLHHADVHRDVRQAIESAARQEGGLLRCIVCTPTLLEGVDFPARTVIAAYPPRTPERRPDISRLRNLEGRAGRAGKFTSGRLVVMTSDHDQARLWRRAMRQGLPPTETALTKALYELQRRAPEQMLVSAGKDIINAVTIEALAESAPVDGDLRRALEEALQRTFWSSTSSPQVDRSTTLARGSKYAAHVGQRLPDAALRAAVYRSGLKLEGCLALRDAIAAKLNDVVRVLRADPPDPIVHERLLRWLVQACVATLEELQDLREVNAESLGDALAAWIAGTSEEEIEYLYPAAWPAVKPRHVETLLVWALTGSFEIIAALADDLDLRDMAHRRLAPSRLRYGVFDAALCPLVRNGADRVQVARVANEYLSEPPHFSGIFIPLDIVVEARIAEEEAAQAEAAAATTGASGPGDPGNAPLSTR
ncbi:DEAD/DEAH box helicase [Rhodococcus sp. IEGM 1408]|uniref:DEAD/DEAH box helicase n=1 Tax=Rhodococcus sp. IEGM 1408 TaxID=3082220 RepID=UPI002954041D|nr:DEAD/DEAH box helicase [Rhodococcus sp. IEGM 1408]MDV8000456.1 DEAD/DEAH box helicase [Rhodococcus sp. IEGM 1408]